MLDLPQFKSEDLDLDSYDHATPLVCGLLTDLYHDPRFMEALEIYARPLVTPGVAASAHHSFYVGEMSVWAHIAGIAEALSENRVGVDDLGA